MGQACMLEALYCVECENSITVQTHKINTSHHLVLIGSDNNYIHDPVQNVTNAGWLHPPSGGGCAARGEVLVAYLLLRQVLQTANLCNSRTEVGHHSM